MRPQQASGPASISRDGAAATPCGCPAAVHHRQCEAPRLNRGRRRLRRFLFAVTVAVVGSNFLPPAAPSGTSSAAAPFITCRTAKVVDGDTLRCGSERIRLLGIDAPEIERCARWRVCAPGDGQAAKRSLVSAVRVGAIRYQSVTTDRYGRIVAMVWAGQTNLSCRQLQRGQAIYKPRWDNGSRIGRACHLQTEP